MITFKPYLGYNQEIPLGKKYRVYVDELNTGIICSFDEDPAEQAWILQQVVVQLIEDKRALQYMVAKAWNERQTS